MTKKTILIVTGTRAEYGLLKPLILGLSKENKYNTKLLVTGIHLLDNYGNTINIIRKDNIHIDYIVDIDQEGDMLSWLSEEVKGMGDIFKNNKFDLVFVLGDRGEPFSAVIAAAHYKVPVAHIHGGDVTGHLPDEYIRNALTKFSHLHFTASDNSYKRVIEMGENKMNVYNIGAIGLDGINKETLLNKSFLAKELNLDVNKKWILFLQHPTPSETSYETQIGNSLEALKEVDAEKIIIYPNSDEGSSIFIQKIKELKNKPNFHSFDNLERNIFLSLLNNINVMVGNSSSGIIESTFFNLNVIDIGNRQQGRERGKNVIDASYSSVEILNKIELMLDANKIFDNNNPYYKGGAIKKIISTLNSIEDFNSLFNNK